jgi:hypothetical protein
MVNPYNRASTGVQTDISYSIEITSCSVFDRVKEDEIVRTCSTDGGEEECI